MERERDLDDVIDELHESPVGTGDPNIVGDQDDDLIEEAEPGEEDTIQP